MLLEMYLTADLFYVFLHYQTCLIAHVVVRFGYIPKYDLPEPKDAPGSKSKV